MSRFHTYYHLHNPKQFTFKSSQAISNNPSTATALYLHILLTELFIESSTAFTHISPQIWQLHQYTRQSNAVMASFPPVLLAAAHLSHRHHRLRVNTMSTSCLSKSRSTVAAHSSLVSLDPLPRPMFVTLQSPTLSVHLLAASNLVSATLP